MKLSAMMRFIALTGRLPCHFNAIMKFCFWSIAIGADERKAMATTVASFREGGLNQDIHILTDDPVLGRCECCDGRGIEKDRGFEQLHCLKSGMSKIPADLLVWIAPGTILKFCPLSIPGMIRNAPLYVPLHFRLTQSRSDLSTELPGVQCRRSAFTKCGASGVVYHSDDSFWMIRRDAIDAVMALAAEFRKNAETINLSPDWSTTLGFIMHMLGADLAPLVIGQESALWAPDYTGNSEGAVGNSKWLFTTPLSDLSADVNTPFVLPNNCLAK